MLTRGKWQQPALFIIICLLFTGLVFSRALLSIATVAFVILLFTQGSLKNRWNRFLSTPLFICISGLFALPLISGLWSADKTTWLHMMETKLPFLFLPLAFAQGFALSQKDWKRVVCFFLVVVTVGTLYSTFLYWGDATYYEAAYKSAKVLPTPMHGDHLRFSLVVSIAVFITLFLLHTKRTRGEMISLMILLAWLLVYLHILAARTGLIATYFIIGCVVFKFLLQKKARRISIPLLLFAISLPFIAWLCFPTFKTRLQYLRYDLTQVFHGHYVPGTTDGNRALSIKGGWATLSNSPWGVGLGDIKHEMNQWYNARVPGIADTDKLYPSSEWLVHGLIAGWIGIVLFTLLLIIPFFTSVRQRFWWCLLLAVLISSFIFDTGLSTQFGIFIHSFSLLMWWQYFKMGTNKISNPTK